ncbi:RNA polymerase-binding protein DksA [Variovorax sp. J22G73]|uniref:RNA polymerase-binding protein DksA n=2 Tax=Variovorax TaxID=34072 RepID=UPI002575DA9F|nr:MULTISPECIES: RNA polymerase-binding protein DksA [unclassified Variovorax]MDM0010266.1 RNA polymerase-binding protein DksA [Variovorax sp. J22R203]MDM0102690.1 RNA polymerase-binding protein DksA [Variovorax sp. J22G73]
MKKPAAKATPATKPAATKAPAAKQAVPAAKKVSAAAHDSPAKEKSASKKPAAAPAKAETAAKKSAKPATAATKTAGAGASSSKPVGRPAAVTSVPSSPMKKTAAASTSAPATPSMPAQTATPAPARGGRVSRLSQLTVPSMPQSVASTAAKSSFSQAPSTALVPPPPLAVKKDPKLANNWKTKTPAELSDAEVIAMPDDEYMNDKQMAFFRLKLAELKRGILENAGETTEHLREDTVVVPDPADRATIEEEHALELRTRDRERKLLKKIEQSIQRIDAGDYGYCDETGEPIGVGRLLARPTATLSLEAQQRRELKQKMFGD